MSEYTLHDHVTDMQTRHDNAVNENELLREKLAASEAARAEEKRVYEAERAESKLLSDRKIRDLQIACETKDRIIGNLQHQVQWFARDGAKLRTALRISAQVIVDAVQSSDSEARNADLTDLITDTEKTVEAAKQLRIASDCEQPEKTTDAPDLDGQAAEFDNMIAKSRPMRGNGKDKPVMVQ